MLKTASHFLRNAALWKAGRESPYHPLFAVLYVTYKCNLACTYCDNGTGKKYPELKADHELDTAGMKDVLGVIRSFADVLNFCGGEPLARRDLEDLVEEAARRRFRTLLLSTNGIGLEKRTRLLGKINYFLVSLDTLDNDKSGSLWGGQKGAVDRVKHTVEWIAGKRKRWGHKVVVNGVITPTNIDDIHQVVEWCLERKVFFSASPQMIGRFPAKELRNNDKYNALIDRLIRLRASGHRVIGTQAFLRSVKGFNEPYRCMPQTLVNIRPDGKIYYPCNRFDRPAGNLLEHRSLKGAVDEGIARNGKFGVCDGFCPTLRYMNGTLLMQSPSRLLEEGWIVSKRGARDWVNALAGWLRT